MTKQFCLLSIIVLGGWMLCGCRQEREISANRPLFIMGGWVKDLAEKWDNIPDELKPYSVMACRGERVEVLHRDCSYAQDKGIPVVAFIRTWYPEVLGRYPPIEEIDAAFGKYPALKGVLICETGAGGFTDGERDYVLRAIHVAAKHGRQVFWDVGQGVWAEVGADEIFCEALRRCRGTLIPMLEMNVARSKYETHGRVLGLWLSGLVENWGINPQGWYWGEAGFRELNTDYGYRLRKLRKEGAHRIALGSITGTTREFEDEVNSHFPMMGQDIMFGCASGATVFWFGGERPPNAWKARDGSISRWWLDTISPLLHAMVERKLIVRCEQIKKAVKLACLTRGTFPFVWDDECAHTGKRSARIVNGCCGTLKLGWSPNVWLPVDKGAEYQFSFWAKTENCDGSIRGVLSWYNKDNMTWTRKGLTPPVSGSHDWREYSVTAESVPDATHVTVHLLSHNNYEGDVWFDDVALRTVGDEENLLPNPGFEEGELTRGRPSGWRSVTWGGDFDVAELHRGLNAVWKATYGMRHWAEFIPNTGRYFWIPVLPSRCGREATDSFEHVIKADENTSAAMVKKTADTVYAKPPGEGFVLNFGEIAFASNSHENTDKSEHARLTVGNYDIEAELGVHNYFVAKLLNDGMFLLVENRYERHSSIRIESARELRVKVLWGDVSVHSGKDGHEARLDIAHDRTKVAALLIR